MRIRPASVVLATLVVVVGALAAALVPAGAGAALSPPVIDTATGAAAALSPELAELARPAVRASSPARLAAAVGTSVGGPGSYIDEDGRVAVEIRFEGGAIDRLPTLAAAGASVHGASRSLQAVDAFVAPADLAAVAAVPGVVSVSAMPAPVILGAGEGSEPLAGDDPTSGLLGSAPNLAVAEAGSTCEGGSVVSEGVDRLDVPAAREAFGLRGAGVTVGVLSDSYDLATQATVGGPIATHAAEDTASGDLPGIANPCTGQQTPVQVIEEAPPGYAAEATDEGRAMLQTVHDVAPHAHLAFATTVFGQLSMAEHIEQLAAPVAAGGAGAKVIADDVFYFDEPFFQDGPVADAVEKVTGEGVTYLSAAANNNTFQGGAESVAGEAGIDSWEAPAFRGASCLLPSFGASCMDFNPGPATNTTLGITVKPGATITVDLQWAEPWGGVHTDLNAWIYNEAGNMANFSLNDNLQTQRPMELVGWHNESTQPETVRLIIGKCVESEICPEAEGSRDPRVKFVLYSTGSSGLQYPVSAGGDTVGPTIFGHAAANGAIAVAAMRYDAAKPEEYSSRGPATMIFEPVSGTTPSAELPAPEVREKPDVTATDCGATTFFGHHESTPWRFCGTSASTPHAAGVAALMVQGAPAAHPGAIALALKRSALPIAGFGPDAVGAGLLDALGALEEIGATPTATDPPSTIVDSGEPKTEPSPEPEVGTSSPGPVTAAPSVEPKQVGSGPPPPRRAAVCTVPRLEGKTLQVVTKKLKAAGCRLGRVTKRRGTKTKSGKVVAQAKKPGTVLPPGSAVKVTLAKG